MAPLPALTVSSSWTGRAPPTLCTATSPATRTGLHTQERTSAERKDILCQQAPALALLHGGRCPQILALLNEWYLSHLCALQVPLPLPGMLSALPLSCCVLPCDLLRGAFPSPRPSHPQLSKRPLLQSPMHPLYCSPWVPTSRALLDMSHPPGCKLLQAQQLGLTGLCLLGTQPRAWHAGRAHGRTLQDPSHGKGTHCCPQPSHWLLHLVIFISSPCRAEACRAGSPMEPVRPATQNEDTCGCCPCQRPAGVAAGLFHWSTTPQPQLKSHQQLCHRAAQGESLKTELGSGSSFTTFLLCDLEQVMSSCLQNG